jgi:hypothetical protein
MKILALSLALLGIFVLIILLNFSSPIIVGNPSELSKLEDNTKVQTQGRVISERTLYEQTKLLKLDNNIEILCQACPPYINRTLKAIGTVETYINRTQVNALKITLQYPKKL